MKRTYRKDYQERHDIDWFAIYEGIPIHVASNGGVIPTIIKSGDNRAVQRYLANLETSLNVDITVNTEWLNQLANIESEHNNNFDKNTYLPTFIEFAKLGFISIDNAIINGEYQYKVVAYPNKKQNLFKNTADVKLPEVSLNEIKRVDLNLLEIK